MTAPLRSFAGLEDGAEVAIVSHNLTQRWKVQDGGLAMNGTRLDPWFFEGLLRDGQIFLSDSAPADVDEWFGHFRDDTWLMLVLKIDGNEADYAQFRNGSFYQFHRAPRLLDSWVRAARPEWATDQLVQMAMLAHSYRARSEDLERKTRNMRDTAHYLSYAKQYLDRAIGAANGTG